MLLGCIADDFTGATDLANTLARGGLRTVQTIGIPHVPSAADADAAVVALKSRTIPAGEAVTQSLAALDWLRSRGAMQIYFKYCSTFDSTPSGNIGPVTEALMDALGCDFTIACPAFPENGRTIFKGHLFVGDDLLSESGMRDHPLTPMRDSNLMRVLQAQTKRKVGHVAYDVVAQGADAIRARFAALKASGVRIAIVDAISDDDLRKLGPALEAMPLVTAGSGVAIGLTANFADRLTNPSDAVALPQRLGYRAIVSGSCSVATRGQVQHFVEGGGAAYAIDVLELAADENAVERAAQWALERVASGPVLVYSTAEPGRVQEVQRQIGPAKAGALVEQALASIAQRLVRAGVTQLVVAGGETSGAVVQALGVTALRIGPQIDPGVPWTATEGGPPILLALKSGNFGSRDFFTKCFALLEP
ncbi:MAG: 3-oxo-tetronate kinase [Burkholderiales bacterium]